MLHVSVTPPRGDYVVKASGQATRTSPGSSRPTATAGRASSAPGLPLVAADEDARVLVLDRLPGRLALGSPHEHDPDVHRQAGTVLRRFHQQSAREDPPVVPPPRADKVLRLLDDPHRIDADTAERVRALFETWVPHPVTVVPTHGDWHPRGTGWSTGAASSPSTTVASRSARPPRTAPGSRPVLGATPRARAGVPRRVRGGSRDPEDWRWLQLREAVGTAVWAYAVHDEAFEAQGQRMLRDALTAF